ncbi:MAG: hypothetical protein RIG68_25885 [Imperialibacter sp.]|uniref:hypothetical protein n=1 Tax=Imperialibacter sp. TaxID=2038411 RepID=UPI0032ED7ED4
MKLQQEAIEASTEKGPVVVPEKLALLRRFNPVVDVCWMLSPPLNSTNCMMESCDAMAGGE